MTKLNLPWLLGLVIGSIGFVVFGFGLHEFQMWRNAPSFIREAKRAQAENRPNDAANYLSRYVKLAPNDTEGLILYGFQLDDLNNVSGAFLTLEKALRRVPDRVDVRRRLVGLAIRLGRFSDAMDHLQMHLLKESPKDAELLEQLSICHFSKGEFKEAESSIETAIANAPERLEAYLKLASMRYAKLGRPGEAIAAIDLMVSQNPENFLAYLYRGQWTMQNLKQLATDAKLGRIASELTNEKFRANVDADAQRTLQLAPDNADVIEFAARVAILADRNDDARELARHGLDIHPADSRFYIVLAELESTAGNKSAAVDLLRRACDVAPKDLGLKWNLANVLIDQDDYVEAREIISKLQAAKHPAHLVNYLDARIKFRQQQWLAAIEQFESIRSQLQSPNLLKQADLWLGLAYREISSPEKQVTCLRRVLDLDPDFVSARMALAEALVSTNRIPEAIGEYRLVLSFKEFPTAALLGLAKTILLANQRKSPDQQNWGEFETLLKQAEQREASAEQLAILRMERSLAKKDSEGATRDIAAAREKNPDQGQLLIAQIALAQNARDWDRVDQLLQEAEIQFGDTPAVRMVKARTLVPRFEEKAREELRKLSTPAESWTEEQRIQLAKDFAPVFLSIQDFDEAERLASLVALAEPKNLQCRLLLMDVALAAKRPELLDQTLEAVRSIGGEGAIWHYGQACRLVLMERKVHQPKDFTDAMEHLRKARSERPNWERILSMMANIQEQQGDLRTAIESYLEAIRLGERSPAVTSRALSLLFTEKRFAEADRLIQELHESQSVFTDEMARAEVSISLQLGHTNQALNLTERLVRESKQGKDPLWLGQVYSSLKDFARAEEQFRLAIKANGKNPRLWVTLVQILTLSKQPQKAEAAIEEAKIAIDPAEAMLIAGQCYEIIGKLDLARNSYQVALQQSPESVAANRAWVDFLMRAGVPAEAEIALNKMLEATSGADETSRENRKWAQRKRVLAILSRNGRPPLNEALAIIQKVLDSSNPPLIDDQRMKAVILSRLPSRNQRQQAIEIVEKLLAQQPESPALDEDRYLLSRLYLMVGDRAKARNELRQLIGARKENSRYIAAYVQFCLQSEEIGEAEIYLDLLKKVVPDETSTFELQTQVYFKQEKYSKIKDLLTKIAKGTASQRNAADLPESRKLAAARRFEDFGQRLDQAGKRDEAARFYAESEVYYKQLIELRPQDKLLLAEFLAKTSQIDRSLDLLQEYGAESPAGLVGSVISAVRRSVDVTDAQLTRLNELLRANVESHDQAPELLLAWADLLSWRGDYPAALKIYADLLSRNDRNVAALNNKSVLITLMGGDQNEAMRLVQKAIEIAGTESALVDTRGLVYLATGQPEKAAVDFEESIAENDSPEHRFHEAIALSRIKKNKLAKQSLERAEALGLSENKLHPLERATLIKLRAQLKDWDKQETTQN